MKTWIKRRSELLEKHFGTRQFTTDDALKFLREYPKSDGKPLADNKNQVIGIISTLVKNNKVIKWQNLQDRRKKFYRFIPADGQENCQDNAEDGFSGEDALEILKLTFISTFFKNAKEQQPEIALNSLFGSKTIDFSLYSELLFQSSAVTVTDPETRKKILNTLGSSDYFTLSPNWEEQFKEDFNDPSLKNLSPRFIADLFNFESLPSSINEDVPEDEDQKLNLRPLGIRPHLALSMSGDLEEKDRVSVHFDDEKEFLSLLPCIKQVYPENYDLTFDLTVDKDDRTTAELFMALYTMALGNITLSIKNSLQSVTPSEQYDFFYVAPASTRRTSDLDPSAMEKEQFRFQDGMPKFTGWLWVQKVYGSLTKGGRGAVVLDRSALSRGGEEQKIRERIIERGILESIILFPKAVGKKAIKQDCMLILRDGRPKAEQDYVLIINAEDIPEDWEDFVEYISELDGDRVGIARAVPVDEVRDREYDLDPWLYVVPSVGDLRETPDPSASREEFGKKTNEISEWLDRFQDNHKGDIPPEEAKMTPIGYISSNEDRVQEIHLRDISKIIDGVEMKSIADSMEKKPDMICGRDFDASGQFNGASGIAAHGSKQSIRKGDILFRIPQPDSCPRPSDTPLWIICTEQMKDRYFSKDFLLIRANSKKVVPEYLHHYLCDSPAGKKVAEDLDYLPCVDTISHSPRRFKKYIGNITVPLMTSLEDQQMVLEKIKELKEFLNLWRDGQSEAQKFIDNLMVGMFMGDFTANIN
ncbi:N-6 DNA methylase [Methanovulcanius yangii]|uniref:N-6 DNA methylase n=1 Tax=Methanovulcanius yangii TaxID=1789227 RepID=UPI0029CA97E9|nr:N-6 DNA methylase [Methanovulcanius yangii]